MKPETKPIFIKLPALFIDASREQVEQAELLGTTEQQLLDDYGVVKQYEYISVKRLEMSKFYGDQEGGVTIFDGLTDRHYPITIEDFLEKLEGIIEVR